MRTRILSGTIAGSIWAIDHRKRRSAERLAAAAFETLLNAIHAVDHETGQHLKRVARYSLILGDAAGLSTAELRAVERIALFHDIGKIHQAILDVVHDGARLTLGERRAIATHPRRGAEVLEPLAPFYPELPRGTFAHHERWDGRGYPRGLRGAAIPFEARLVSVADTFDVIANGRHYRRAGGARKAAMEIGRGRGTQFDPDIVDLLTVPPVLDQLVAAHRASYARRSRSADRRHPSDEEHLVPDIRFRWRESLDGGEAPSASQRPKRST